MIHYQEFLATFGRCLRPHVLLVRYGLRFATASRVYYTHSWLAARAPAGAELNACSLRHWHQLGGRPLLPHFTMGEQGLAPKIAADATFRTPRGLIAVSSVCLAARGTGGPSIDE
jgi:hypothetical protein